MAKQADPRMFIYEGAGSYNLAVPRDFTDRDHRKPQTAEEKKIAAANENLYQRVGDSYIVFNRRYSQSQAEPSCAYVTTDLTVAKFLREQAKERGLPIREDLSLLRIRCPYCDFVTAGNSVADQRSLAEHIAESHDEAE